MAFTRNTSAAPARMSAAFRSSANIADPAMARRSAEKASRARYIPLQVSQIRLGLFVPIRLDLNAPALVPAPTFPLCRTPQKHQRTGRSLLGRSGGDLCCGCSLAPARVLACDCSAACLPVFHRSGRWGSRAFVVRVRIAWLIDPDRWVNRCDACDAIDACDACDAIDACDASDAIDSRWSTCGW